MKRLSERWLRAAYRQRTGWLYVLTPLAWLYRCVIKQRAQAYATGQRDVWHAPVPVIVVGNLTLGGTGKSPLVAWLARFLADNGWRPGILSRGYGGKSHYYPLLIEDDTPASVCGDEPRMLADQCNVPVVVDPDRPRGGRLLVEQGCDIVLSDDGLQHLALARTLELVVVDGYRGLGNGRCLPAGPLREPVERLNSVDAVIVNGELRHPLPVSAWKMDLNPAAWRVLGAPAEQRCSLFPLPFSPPVHAVAAIGRPARFFETLTALGLKLSSAVGFADHHRFCVDELSFDDGKPLVMTAKDAVKCHSLDLKNAWVLDVDAAPEPAFVAWLEQQLIMLRSA
ncbi:tetraacyldisaccharide 4'-kinase [Halomonas halocynthiae]|uniref:tetraacyldisaccharide 4'-kinase n=1 Tax=Halomonas halocynthiae TaxID=176290 RepID=UPI0003F61270|nr:tetraacyldisaccharide 4'-kinase [Halomonas halocynthiae]